MIQFINKRHGEIRLGPRVKFHCGFFETDDADEADVVRQNPGFGRWIHEIDADDTEGSLPQELAEYSASPTALAELKRAGVTLEDAARLCDLPPGGKLTVQQARQLARDAEVRQKDADVAAKKARYEREYGIEPEEPEAEDAEDPVPRPQMSAAAKAAAAAALAARPDRAGRS